MDEFSGKKALLTGGTAGIGLACAKELLSRGLSKLAIVDINVRVDSCRSIAAEFGKDRLKFVECDVSQKDQMEEAFKSTVEEFGSLDIVVNNAGIMNDLEWETELAVNLNGTIQGTLLGLKYMSKGAGGSGGVIINISSLDGLVPSASHPIYSAGACGIIGFTRAFSLPFHYSKTEVRLICICPGITFTKAIKNTCSKMLNEEIGKEWVKNLSSVYMQRPEKVADAIIQAIKQGKNGSILVSDGAKPVFAVEYPQLDDMQSVD